jgi:hypothetical protein
LIPNSFTVVENFATFWTNQQSQFVLVSPGDLPTDEPTDEPTEETTEVTPEITTM